MSKYLFILLITISAYTAPSRVHLQFQGCRTGDRMMHYVKGRWIAKKLGLEMGLGRVCTRVKPFRMVQLHPDFDRERAEPPLKRKYLTQESDIRPYHRRGHDLFVAFSYRDMSWDDPMEVGTWTNVMKDRPFRNAMGRAFEVIDTKWVQKLLVTPPKGKMSVALHIRTGEGVDRPRRSAQFFDAHRSELKEDEIYRGREYREQCKTNFVDVIFPIKFPPYQYYLEQLKRLYYQLGCQPLYVYLFTDAKNPGELARELEQKLDFSEVEIDYYRGSQKVNHRAFVDFVSMTHFDCLIRGGSHYGQIAHLIGDHKIVIYPRSYFWARDALYMDQIVTEVNHEI